MHNGGLSLKACLPSRSSTVSQKYSSIHTWVRSKPAESAAAAWETEKTSNQEEVQYYISNTSFGYEHTRSTGNTIADGLLHRDFIIQFQFYLCSANKGVSSILRVGGTYFSGGSGGSPPENFERCRCNFPHSGIFAMFLDKKNDLSLSLFFLGVGMVCNY